MSPMEIGEWTMDTHDDRVKIAPCGCLTDAQGFLLMPICQAHSMAMASRRDMYVKLWESARPRNAVDPHADSNTGTPPTRDTTSSSGKD